MFIEQLPFLFQTLFLNLPMFSFLHIYPFIVSLSHIHSWPLSLSPSFPLSIFPSLRESSRLQVASGLCSHKSPPLQLTKKEIHHIDIETMKRKWSGAQGHGQFSQSIEPNSHCKDVRNSFPWKWLLTDRNHWKSLRLSTHHTTMDLTVEIKTPNTLTWPESTLLSQEYRKQVINWCCM